MKLEVIPKLTKEIVLKKYSQEELMLHFTKCEALASSILSPLREEKHKSASFYYNKKGELRLKDFKIGFNGNVFDVIMYMYNVSFDDALYIAYTLDTKPIPVKTALEKTPKPIADIKVKVKDFSKKDLDYWASYGISYETLVKFNVFSCKYVLVNGNIIFNRHYCFCYYFYNDQYKIYFPESLRKFICNTNVLQGLHQLPEKGDILIITKSYKDVMVYDEIGLPAVAPQSESTFINENIINNLKSRFSRIIVNYDWDRTGKINMIKMRKAYGFECKAFKDTKDISDYVKKYGIDKCKQIVYAEIEKK